jgi:NCS1 family nucleobase:cation symporter-1
MGVKAPIGVTRFYFFAYWVGLALSGLTFWVSCKQWPPAVMEHGWKEPRDYVRPEEDEANGVIEAVNMPGEAIETASGSEKHKGVSVV